MAQAYLGAALLASHGKPRDQTDIYRKDGRVKVNDGYSPARSKTLLGRDDKVWHYHQVIKCRPFDCQQLISQFWPAKPLNNKLCLRFPKVSLIATMRFCPSGLNIRPPSCWPSILRSSSLRRLHNSRRLFSHKASQICHEIALRSSNKKAWWLSVDFRH